MDLGEDVYFFPGGPATNPEDGEEIRILRSGTVHHSGSGSPGLF